MNSIALLIWHVACQSSSLRHHLSQGMVTLHFLAPLKELKLLFLSSSSSTPSRPSHFQPYFIFPSSPPSLLKRSSSRCSCCCSAAAVAAVPRALQPLFLTHVALISPSYLTSIPTPTTAPFLTPSPTIPQRPTLPLLLLFSPSAAAVRAPPRPLLPTTPMPHRSRKSKAPRLPLFPFTHL